MTITPGLDKNNVVIITGNPILCDYWEQVDSMTCSQNSSDIRIYVIRKDSHLTALEKNARYNTIYKSIINNGPIPKLTIVICESENDAFRLEVFLVDQCSKNPSNLNTDYFINNLYQNIDEFIPSIIHELYSKDTANYLCREFMSIHNTVYEVIK